MSRLMSVQPSICLSVQTSRQIADILIAELGDVGFDLFSFDEDNYSTESDVVQSENPSDVVTLNGYTTAAGWTEHQADVDSLLKRYLPRADDAPVPASGVLDAEFSGVTGTWRVSEIDPQNWNATWEASIQPISVPPFLIRPSWYEPDASEQGLIDLLIDPKMSFGTGYHETTRLMLGAIAELSTPGQHVLDAGSGTGILAIAACKIGAEKVVAFDFDEWCAINARENFEQNGCADQVTWYTGEMSCVPADKFDLILANINRNVLIEILPALRTRLHPAGIIVLAGLLTKDRDLMLEHISNACLIVSGEDAENEWWSVRLGAA